MLPLARLSTPLGRAPSDQKLNIAIGLPLRNQQTLLRLLDQIYDPSSPQFQQYLTAAQFAEQFGPTEQDYQRVIEFARTNGLAITALHPNRMLVDVRASVGELEKAFQLSLQLYSHPTEPRTFYAPATEPRLPADLAVLHVSGLDNYVIARPASLHPAPSGGAHPVPQVGSGPGGAYRGNDFRGAYTRGTTLSGTGQMVGLLEFDGYYLDDITSYRNQSSVANVPILNVTMDGFDGTPSGNNIEVALDIEMVSSVAPGLSQILVYEAGPSGVANDILNRMATDNLARQLSASWTYPIDPTTEQIFREFAAQGQAYFNASGDGGAYVGAVSAPADEPYVTVVGGTVLSTTGPGGAWTSETSWNRGGTGSSNGGTGGGISTTYPIPSWQRQVNMSFNQGSVSMRNLPDVAAVADNVWVTYNNGSSQTVGGTSCSAPLWAAYLALANQQAAAFGRPPVGFLNPQIYKIGLSAGYTTNFHDVTIGNNTNGASPNQFFAAPGYDLCTGWGSPIGPNLINTLAPRLPMPVITNASATILVEGCSPPNGAINPGETVTVNFSLKNLGAIKTTNLIAILQASTNVLAPSAPQSYGVLSGGGPAVIRAFSFTAIGDCGQTITPTFKLVDGPTFLGTLGFNFQLGVPVTAFAENFDAASALPSGWTTDISSNAISPWVISTTQHDTLPNAVFADEPPSPGIEELISPPIAISSSSAQLVFRNSYNTEADPNVASKAFDGGVLEIQLGTNDFTDILAAGGSFAAGGYVRTISTDTNDDNPLAGRRAWGGNSGGFISSVVNLPAAAAGQTIVLKWRFALDTGNFYGGSGWFIDTISIKDGASCCVSSADLAVSVTATPDAVAPGQPLTYDILVTNLGSSTASGVVVTNLLPGNVLLSAVSPGCFESLQGYVLCQAGTLSAGAATNFSLTVLPQASDPLTNFVQLFANTPDPALSNNSMLTVSLIATDMPPVIYQQPGDVVALQGTAATFRTTVFGVQPLGYQWLFNGSPLPGQTANTLALTNVQPADMGAYSVMVTNGNGSVTSAPAQLTILGPPAFQLGTVSLAADATVISLQSSTSQTYLLQYKDSLTDTNWITILPPVPGDGSIIQLQDTNAATSSSRFYRVSAQ